MRPGLGRNIPANQCPTRIARSLPDQHILDDCPKHCFRLLFKTFVEGFDPKLALGELSSDRRLDRQYLKERSHRSEQGGAVR
jgi:hypothetical protein